MEPPRVRTEQPAAKRGRGPGRPFTQSDPRINRGGVPSEVRAFHTWMRQTFARSLQEGTEDGLTYGEHIIRTLIQKAKDGDMKAIEMVLDRMGGKPLQAVEVATEYSFDFLSEAERIRITGSVEKIKRMQAEAEARRQEAGRTLTVLPSASESARQAAHPTSASLREDGTNAPSKPNLRAPVDRPTPGTRLACRHNFERHQCPICAQLGEY